MLLGDGEMVRQRLVGDDTEVGRAFAPAQHAHRHNAAPSVRQTHKHTDTQCGAISEKRVGCCMQWENEWVRCVGRAFAQLGGIEHAFGRALVQQLACSSTHSAQAAVRRVHGWHGEWCALFVPWGGSRSSLRSTQGGVP